MITRGIKTTLVSVLLWLTLTGLPAHAGSEDVGEHPVTGELVYGDPAGRFTIPLVGEWEAVEMDESTVHFRSDPRALDLWVVGSAPDRGGDAIEDALRLVGIDPAAVQLVQETDESAQFPGWLVRLYGRPDGQVVGALTRDLGGDPVTIVGVGELSSMFSGEAILSVGRMVEGPIDEFLADAASASDPQPGSIAAIDDLDRVPFMSGGQTLVGSLLLPAGDGPFPAVVLTHGSGQGPRTRGPVPPQGSLARSLVDAGFVVLAYDKRGVGASDGVFIEVGPETGHWRLPQLADDALAAADLVRGLDEIDPERVGIIGGSQAGWVNVVAAAESDDLAFVVSIVGPTVSVGREILYSDLTGEPPSVASLTSEQQQGLRDRLAAFEGPEGFDPRPAIESMSVPGLWIWGEDDASVPTPESRTVLEEVNAAGDDDLDYLIYPDQGHAIDRGVYLGDMLAWIEEAFASGVSDR